MNNKVNFLTKKREGALGQLFKSILFILLFVIAGIGSQDAFAQNGCTINSVNFSPINTTESIEGQKTKITVNLTGCEEGIQIIPKETFKSPQAQNLQAENLDQEVEIDNNPSNIYIPDEQNKIEVEYWLYEDGCFADQPGFDCKYYVLIKYLGEPVFNGRDYIQEIETGQEYNQNYINGVLFASCGNGFFDVCDGANNSWEYKWSNVQPLSYKECKLEEGDVEFINTPFDDIGDKSIQLKIKTKNKCTGIPIRVHLMSLVGNSAEPEDPGNFDGQIDIEPEVDGNDYIQVIAEEGKDVVISFIGHDEECIANNSTGTVIITAGISTLFGDSDDEYFDCTHYVKITNKNNKLIYSTRDNFIPWFNNTMNITQFNSQVNFKKGVIGADCYGVCGGNDWEYKSMVGGYGDDDSSISAQQINTQQPTYDVDSPCYDSGTQSYDENCYELLASIPGIGETENGRTYIGDLKNYKIQDYINQLFRVALGILLVLSVVMIIVAGVEYMTVESIYGKSDAKKRILGATMGLILALGIFLILKTINPKLLQIDFGANIKTVSIQVLEDPAAADGNGNSSSINTSPATNICNNREDKGYWKGQTAHKQNTISQTAQNESFQSLEVSGVNLSSINENNVQSTTIVKSVKTGFASKIIELSNNLVNEGLTPRVTEAFGPTFLGHGSPCHYKGSCIDLGLKQDGSEYNIDNIEKVIRLADAAGLTAQFEFSQQQSSAQAQAAQAELISRGIDGCMVKYISNATNWHFSIYNKSNLSIGL